MSLTMATRFSQCLPTLAQTLGFNYVYGSGSQVTRISFTISDDYVAGGSWQLTVNETTLTAVNAYATFSGFYSFPYYVKSEEDLKDVIMCRARTFYQASPIIRSAFVYLIAKEPNTSFTYSVAVTQPPEPFPGTIGYEATELELPGTALPASTEGKWGGNLNDTTGGSFVGQMQPITAFSEVTLQIDPYTEDTALVNDNGWKSLTGIKVTDTEYNSAEENTFKVSITDYPNDSFGGFCWKDGEMYITFNWLCNMWSSDLVNYPLLRVKMFNRAYSDTAPVQTWDVPEDVAFGSEMSLASIVNEGTPLWLRIPDTVIETLQNNWIGTEIEFIAAPESVGGSWIYAPNETFSGRAWCRPEADDGAGTGARNTSFGSAGAEDEFWKSIYTRYYGRCVAMSNYVHETAEFTIDLQKPSGRLFYHSGSSLMPFEGWLGDPETPRRQINMDLMEDPRGEGYNTKYLHVAGSKWPRMTLWENQTSILDDCYVKVTLLAGAVVICTREVIGFMHPDGPKNELHVSSNYVSSGGESKITNSEWDKLNAEGQRNLKVKVECTGYDDGEDPGSGALYMSEFAVTHLSLASKDTVFQAISIPVASDDKIVSNPVTGQSKTSGPVQINSHINNPFMDGDVPETTTSFSVGVPDTPDEPYTRNWGQENQWLPLSRPVRGPSDIDLDDFGFKANINAWHDAVFENNQGQNRCYYAAFDTSNIDLKEDVLLAGDFVFRMYVTSKGGYIGTFLQPSAYRSLRFTMYYEKDGGGAQYIDGFDWSHGDSDDNDGFVEFLCDATGKTRLADLMAGGVATNRNVYCQIQALPDGTTPTGGWSTNDYEGFDTGSFLYPTSLILSTSDETNVSDASGWTVVGANSVIEALTIENDDSYVELDYDTEIVVGFPAPYINYARDFTEAESLGMSEALEKNAYSFWSTATDANKKFVEARIASVAADDSDLRIEWWFDPERDPYYDSRLKNTSQLFDISECPTWAFGEDGSPNGNSSSAGWHTDDAVAGLTPTQQGQTRVMLRNKSAGPTQKVRVSNLRMNINPLTFAHVNCAKSRLIFEPHFGQ